MNGKSNVLISAKSKSLIYIKGGKSTLYRP